MSLKVTVLRLYKGWLPDTWTYSFNGTTYEVQETFTNVPAHEMEKLEASAIGSGFKVLSRSPFVCKKRMNKKEATAQLLHESAVQAGGLGLISYSTQGIILDDLLESNIEEVEGNIEK